MRFGPLGIWEILIILVVVLLLFGPRRLPEMAKGIGQSVREFRKGIRDLKDDISKDDEPTKASNVTVSSDARTESPRVETTRIEPSQSSAAPTGSTEHIAERVAQRPVEVVEQPAQPVERTVERTEVKSA